MPVVTSGNSTRVIVVDNKRNVTTVEAQPTTTILPDTRTVSSISDETRVVNVSSPGPQGQAGLAGSTSVLRVTPLAIGGHRIVYSAGASNVALASSSDTINSDNILGLTLMATTAGATTQVQTYGSITEPSWAWTTGEPLFLALNGLLSHALPATGVIIPLGFAENATTIFLDIGTPIYID